MVYMRAVELAGGLPVVLPPLAARARRPARRAARRASASPAARTSRPPATARSAAPRARADRAGAGRVRARASRAQADRLGLPILGICRGLQALNVARGGTLHQHLPDVTDGSIDHRQTEPGHVATHDVRIAPGSRLAGILGADGDAT